MNTKPISLKLKRVRVNPKKKLLKNLHYKMKRTTFVARTWYNIKKRQQ